MLMPSLLPPELAGYAECETEESLYNQLIHKPADLVAFFDYAGDDETWSQKYSDFMKKTIHWMTILSFQGKLSADLLNPMAKTIRSHFENLRGLISYNIIFRLEDTSIRVNSALYSDASLFFQELIYRECFDKKIFRLELLNVSYAKTFCYVEEFVNTGDVATLWKMGQKELMHLLHYATSVQLFGLSLLCEQMLGKFLLISNVYPILLMAQNESLITLTQLCFDFINHQNLGLYLTFQGPGTICCQFLNFLEKALESFDKIHEGITHLVFSDDVPSDPAFSTVLCECPKLQSLNLSHTDSYPEYITSVPASLHEIYLTACPWLTSHHIKKIIDLCPSLQRMHLSSNVQLTMHAWGELMRLRSLDALDLNRCQQIRDEDFRIILHACGGITELSVEDCKLISHKGFYDLSRGCPRLLKLDVSRTHIGDASLVEIASKCKSLVSINLTRCENMTDHGFIELVRHGFNLKEINIANCKITKSILDEIKKQKPNLIIIH